MFAKFTSLILLLLSSGLSTTGCMTTNSKSSDASKVAAAGDTEGETYMVIFGFQGTGPFNIPARSHSYASVFRLRRDAGGRMILSDSHTISWLPADGFVSVLTPQDKPGRNFTLRETVSETLNGRRAVRDFGVFQVQSSLFSAFKQRKLDLDRAGARGGVFYTSLPNMEGRRAALRLLLGESSRPGHDNCISAIADVMSQPDDQLLDTGMNRGFSASQMIFDSFSDYRLSLLRGISTQAVVEALLAAESRGGDVVLGGGTDSDGDHDGDRDGDSALSLCGRPTQNTQVCIAADRRTYTIRSLVTGQQSNIRVQQTQPSSTLPGGTGFIGAGDLRFFGGLGPNTTVSFVVNDANKTGRLFYLGNFGWTPWAGNSGVFSLSAD